MGCFFPQGNCPKVSSINDRNDWKVVRKALTVIGFNEDEVEVKIQSYLSGQITQRFLQSCVIISCSHRCPLCSPHLFMTTYFLFLCQLHAGADEHNCQCAPLGECAVWRGGKQCLHRLRHTDKVSVQGKKVNKREHTQKNSMQPRKENISNAWYETWMAMLQRGWEFLVDACFHC